MHPTLTHVAVPRPLGNDYFSFPKLFSALVLTNVLLTILRSRPAAFGPTKPLKIQRTLFSGPAAFNRRPS